MMHLQSLELFGFKSFADKTIFNFHQGVTAIVGPNGCGKSNVCDAVRWVLGEQSAKSLRGGEMADVIFNGSESRKPLGYAEVSLTFSDCASELGVDWHEVRVSRRLYRDGNSEYLLNKTVCRLKDIQNLFADTGVGRDAYSIMEQGKIDLILSSHPEDRRSVFEEAAGITKYKTQKKEALRKLEATEANLLRVGDIIKEVKRQIGSLQRQAGKARRYQALHADLQTLDTHLSHRKLQKLESELGQSAEKISWLTNSERETRTEIDEGERQLSDARARLDRIDEQVTAVRDTLQQLENEIASHRNRIAFNEQHGRELNALIGRNQREITDAEAKLAEHETEIASATVLLEETSRLLEQQRTEIAEATRIATEQRVAREHAEHALREVQLELSKSELRLGAVTTERQELTQRRDATKRGLESLESRIRAAADRHAQLQATVERSRSAAQTEQQTAEQLYWRVRTQESDLRAQETALIEIDKKLAALERAIAEKESRLDVLRQLNQEGEGLAKGSQALLQSSEFDVAGALAAQLDVRAEFVAAIEAALGRNLNAVLLADPRQAVGIVDHLNANQLGQAAIVLGQMVFEKDRETLPLPKAALGWAIEQVNAPDSLLPVISRLLQHVALFATLQDALENAQPGIGAATLRGEFISPCGILFAGSGPAGPQSLLERKTHIDSIAGQLATLRTEQGHLEQRRQSIEAQIAAAEAALEHARLLHQNAQAAQSVGASKVVELEREHHSASRDLEMLQSERATLESQIAIADARLAQLAADCAELQTKAEADRNNLEALSVNRETAAQEEDRANARLAELRVVFATYEERHETLLAQRAPMLARQKELREIISTRATDILSYEGRLREQDADTVAAKTAIQEQTANCETCRGRLAELSRERAAELIAITEQEERLRRSRNRLSELQEERGRHSVRHSQLQLQIEHLLEHVLERYHLDLRQFEPDWYAHEKVLRAQLKRAARDTGPEGETAPTEPTAELSATDDDLQRLLTDLSRQLDNMGPVNLEAVQEYDELEERYRFLESQNQDLRGSRRELLDVIARINSTTQRLFGETFAQVRVNFREMFGELFGGGRADLQLTDESDALNCGIDIIAKPPGKQLQNISLLSGGEKTMTAVALLFAIYMVRPSPFCLLDEMDAPLDESNINRFIRVLERFVKQSQFIIITHNKRTIAKADVLYGVTMEERGVSKLVGMKMIAPPHPDAAAGPRLVAQSGVTATQGQFVIADPESQRSFAAR